MAAIEIDDSARSGFQEAWPSWLPHLQRQYRVYVRLRRRRKFHRLSNTTGDLSCTPRFDWMLDLARRS